MAKLNHTVTGKADAPWLTLAHSLATDMRMWRPQLQELDKHFRILRYDARGHGGSPLSNNGFGMQALAQDVLDLWDSLGIEKSHFVGLSMGGMTGVGLALQQPERLIRLVACDCRLDAPPFFCEMWEKRIAAVRQGGLAAIVDEVIETWLYRPDADTEKLARHMILDTPPETYIACARALKTLDYKPYLASLSIPVLLLVGEHDGVHPQEMQQLHQLVPDSKLTVLENAAHLSNLEQAAAFNRAVTDFLTADSAEAQA